METSAEHRLYDAAARCPADPRWADPARPIEAAAQALVDGLDSPALRELAGEPWSARPGPLRRLLLDALEELGIPNPDGTSPGHRVSGTSYARLPTDRLRLEIRTGEEVLIHVNGLEITEAGAGMGMHPFDLFVPANQLVATSEPRRVIVARCTCGESGCGSTEATITRDDGIIHWDWSVDVPLGHGVTFEAPAYDAEIARIGSDRSWQRPVDTASRLVLEVPGLPPLPDQGAGAACRRDIAYSSAAARTLAGNVPFDGGRSPRPPVDGRPALAFRGRLVTTAPGREGSRRFR
ncbi:hypothetical protein AB0L64_00370 [Kribbella sp. NPDC051936]|uniref:hypothetical protein n=1 Tax=Kribbella sp. NPDC051936 TaxID=3154946 RepID=UPI00342D8D32